MNSSACFDSGLESPVSIQSYGDLSDILPPRPSERYESDLDDVHIQRNVSNDDTRIDWPECVEPVSALCGINDANYLYGTVDYCNDDLQMFMIDYSCDENMLRDGDTDVLGEIQLDRDMRSDRIYSSHEFDPSTKKEDPIMRSNIHKHWKSERIDPPAKNAKSVTHQFFVILEVFVLRCAFDHLRRAKCTNEDTVCNLNKRRGSLSPKLSRSSSLRTEQKQPETSPYNVPHAIERMRYNLDERRNQVLVVHRQVLKKALQSWRATVATASKLRQKYYLMMIVNRWQLYTDECVDLRRKRDIALLHWASFRCKKSFDVLKLYAKQSKEQKRLASVLQYKVGRVNLSYERDASLRFVSPSISDSKIKANPSISKTVLKVLSDNRVSLARNWFDNIRNPLLQAGSVSTLTSTMRQSSPSLQRDFQAQQAQSFVSTKCYSAGMPSPYLLSSVSTDKLNTVLAGTQQRFAHGVGRPKSRSISG